MAELDDGRRMSDRKEGRTLRSLPAYTRLAPYIMKRRSEACCTLSDSVEVSGIEQWLLEKRGEGWSGLGFLHLLAAAYVRTVSMRPGINRFVAGRRICARDDIQIVMTVRRGQSIHATQTSIKVGFSPRDTVFDVYRRLSEAVDAIRADVTVSEPERLASSLGRLPRVLLRPALACLRALDYFDWLPRKMLEASPFHGSLRILDLGSLGVPPVNAPLADFGTIPCCAAFGAKRRAMEQNAEGRSEERHYVDYRITCDGRVVDAAYYASALKCLKYFLKNPKLLELPPETVEEDVN